MCKNRYRYLLFMFFWSLFLLPKCAFANVGLPMIWVSWPLMSLAFIPIVAIEAMVFIKILRIDIKKSLLISFWANLISTLVGTPLAWLLYLAIELIVAVIAMIVFKMQSWPPNQGLLFVPLVAALLGPVTEGSELMVPVAIACGLIPAYFLSIWIEFGIAKKIMKDLPDKKILYKAVKLANLASYLMLIGLCIAMFVFNRFSDKLIGLCVTMFFVFWRFFTGFFVK